MFEYHKLLNQFTYLSLQILHLAIDNFAQSPLDNNVNLISSLQKFPFISTKDELLLILDFIANAYQQYCLNVATADELKASFFNLSTEFQQIAVDVIEARKPEVLTQIIANQNATKDLLLDSFDWDVKWILGNSSLSSQRQQFASFLLNCRDGAKTKEIHFEMSKARLDDFINVLEKCEQELSSAEVEK
jgi:COMM domain containing 8